MISELHLKCKLPLKIYKDCNGYRNLCKNPVHHSRTKHFDIGHHFLRDHKQCDDIILYLIQNQEMIADMLNKSLGSALFQKLIREMRLSKLTTRGSAQVNVL